MNIVSSFNCTRIIWHSYVLKFVIKRNAITAPLKTLKKIEIHIQIVSNMKWCIQIIFVLWLHVVPSNISRPIFERKPLKRINGFYYSRVFKEDELPFPSNNEFSRSQKFGTPDMALIHLFDLLQCSIVNHTSLNYHETITLTARAIKRARDYCTVKQLYDQRANIATELRYSKVKQYKRINTLYRIPCGAVDIVQPGTNVRMHTFSVSVPIRYHIVLTVYAFITVHNIFTVYRDDGEDCVQNMLVLHPRNIIICGSHAPVTYHLLTHVFQAFYYDYYNDTTLYLSLLYEIKYTRNNTETHMQYIFSHSPINTVVPISLAHHYNGYDSTIDLFVFHILVDTLDNANIYLYRTINCTARLALYKVLDGPISVHESALCHNNDSVNHNLRNGLLWKIFTSENHLFDKLD